MTVLQNPLLRIPEEASADDYEIPKSIRINRHDYPWITSDLQSNGDRSRLTISVWYKFNGDTQGSIDTNDECYLYAGDTSYLRILGTGKLSWDFGYNDGRLTTSDKFIDAGKWYHVVATADTTKFNASERLKLYINGERIYTFDDDVHGDRGYQSTTIGVKGAWRNFGTLHSIRPWEGLLAEARYFDGIALDAADLGKFDENGIWQPKEPKLNPINDGTTWSSAVTGTVNGSYPATNLFDGKDTTACRAGNGETLTWKPAADIEAGSDIRIRVKFVGTPYGNGVVLKVNGISIVGSAFDDHIGDGNTGWYPLRRMFRGEDLRKITAADGIQWSTSSDGSKYAELLGIEVDGKILKDGYYDPPALNNPNDGRNWSAQLTESTGNGWNNPANYSFNGSLHSASIDGTTSDSDVVTWTPNPGVPYTKNVEIWVAGYDNGYYQLNGGSWEDQVNSETHGWQQIATGSGTITSLATKRGSGNDVNAMFVAAIKVDGYVLLDRHIPHDCHLDFKDGTTAYRLGWGKDDGSSGVAAYTDGTDIQWGTDANKSDLVLCLPGYDSADKHHLIKGSGSAKALTVDSSLIHTTDDDVSGGYGLYGRFLKFNGSSTKIVATGSSDYDFGTGNFTLEAWCWRKSGSGTIMSSHNYNTAGTDGNWRIWVDGTNGTVEFKCYDGTSSAETISANMPDMTTQCWQHFAVVRRGTGSNQTSLYCNGEEIATGTITKDLSAGANNINIGATVTASGSSDFFQGNLNDVRVYKGAAKYATGLTHFKPPWRYDFGIRNIDVVNSDLDSKRSSWQKPVYYTGNSNSTQDIDVGFRPGMMWVKRLGSNNAGSGGFMWFFHELDGIASGTFELGSTDNSFSGSDLIDGTTSTGFTAKGNMNADGEGYVAWCWRVGDGANSSAYTGGDQDINSSVCLGVEPRTGSGSFTAIVKYTGNGQSDQKVGHGMGNNPGLVIIKENSNNTSWYCSPFGGSNNHYYRMNSNDARTNNNSPFSGSRDTSTITVTGNANNNGSTYYMFIWAYDSSTISYHSDGSYGGGGSGVWTLGGPPAMTWFKGQDWDYSNWILYDIERDKTPPKTKYIKLNQAENEGDSSNYGILYPHENTKMKINDTSNIADDIYKNNNVIWRWTFHGDDPSWEVGSYGFDSYFDSPTNKVPDDGDSGVGGEVLGSYCTANKWNTPTGSGLDIQGAGLLIKNDFEHGTHDNANIIFTHPMSTGKWYWEAEIVHFGHVGATGSHVRIGVTSVDKPYGDDGDGKLGAVENSFGFICDNRRITNGSAGTLGHDGTLSDSVPVGEKVMMAFDADAKKLWFGRKGQWLRISNNQGAVGDPANGNNPHYSTANGMQDGPWVPAVCIENDVYVAFNFGQRPFTYTAPTGFKCLCTANYPDCLEITADGKEWKNNGRKAAYVTKYRGDSTTSRDIWTGFKPGLIWTKVRNDATIGHNLVDIVRGAGKCLDTDTDAAEADDADTVTHFLDDGYRLSNDTKVNSNSYEYMSWCWNAGAVSTSANNNGDINIPAGNQAASNATGFSITKYAGNNTNGATIPHGLDAPPAMIMIKNLDSQSDFLIYHKDLGNGNHLKMTDAAKTTTTILNSTDPGSTYVNLSAIGNVNGTENYIMYAWKPVPGFSQFGSFKGHGWNQFITTDFAPMFVMFKRTDGTGDWIMFSEMRDEIYYSSKAMELSDTGVELDDHANNHLVEFFSNGFRPGGGNMISAAGQDYVYAAFGEWPFKVARGR